MEEGTDIAAEIWEADGESAQSQVRSVEVWEAATREVSKELVARSQESWRVWKVPSRNPFRRLRLPRWLTKGIMLTSLSSRKCRYHDVSFPDQLWPGFTGIVFQHKYTKVAFQGKRDVCMPEVAVA